LREGKANLERWLAECKARPELWTKANPDYTQAEIEDELKESKRRIAAAEKRVPSPDDDDAALLAHFGSHPKMGVTP
jgi:hypothetical protein